MLEIILEEMPPVKIVKSYEEMIELINHLNVVYIHSKKVADPPKVKSYFMKSTKEKQKRIEKVTEIVQQITKLPGVLHLEKYQEFLINSYQFGQEIKDNEMIEGDSFLLKNTLPRYKILISFDKLFFEFKNKSLNHVSHSSPLGANSTSAFHDSSSLRDSSSDSRDDWDSRDPLQKSSRSAGSSPSLKLSKTRSRARILLYFILFILFLLYFYFTLFILFTLFYFILFLLYFILFYYFTFFLHFSHLLKYEK